MFLHHRNSLTVSSRVIPIQIFLSVLLREAASVTFFKEPPKRCVDRHLSGPAKLLLADMVYYKPNNNSSNLNGQIGCLFLPTETGLMQQSGRTIIIIITTINTVSGQLPVMPNHPAAPLLICVHLPLMHHRV